MNEPMQVVFTASRNLYPYITGAIYSLLHYNPNTKVWLFLEDDDVPYKLPEQCEVVNVSGQKFWGDECPNINTPYTYLSLMRATYALLFTGRENRWGIRKLPKLDKILQLDVDVVVRGDLRPLWDADMTGKWFFMADEVLTDYRPLGPEPHYFNCGVCVFNLEQMRADGIDREEIEWLNTVKIRCIDQDCHNAMLKKYGYDKCLIMAARYNSCFATGSGGPNRDIVVHACGEKWWYRDFDRVYRGAEFEKWSKYYEEEACRIAGIKF